MRFGDIVLSEPWVLYLIIPLVIGLFYLLRKRFVKEEERLFRSRGRKRMTLIFRSVFFFLVLLALSNPVIEHRDVSGNITKVKVLVDRSYSMQLHDIDKAMESINGIEIPVEIKELDMKEYSSLGTEILSNMESGENILVITDGQNNFGSDLKDVSVFASTIGVHIFGMKIDPREDDGAIYVEGPGKVVSGVENTFTVGIREVGDIGEKKIRVLIDREVAYEGIYRKEIELKRTFDTGTHYIEAVLEKEDHFLANNRFFKAINVLERPNILFLSNSKSPLLELYHEFYDVDVQPRLPENLTKYHAAVIDNMGLDDMSVGKLERFLNDENGVLVVGGKESYDWGNYNSSDIMGILPVEIGKARKRKDIVSIVIVMDTGASGGELLSNGVSKFDVQKALAVDVIRSISSQNKVGFIEANFYLNTLTGLSELGPKRAQMANDIALLKPHGFSELRFAYEKAHEALRLSRGSRNIVIITDGKLIPQDQAITLDLTQKAHDDGIKTFIIGVGESADEAFLISMKEAGGGEYFRTDDTQRIKLYFGDASENPEDDLDIFVYDSNHFITMNIERLGKIYGYNSVYPKSNARMLLTTSTGDPLLTVWNYGLGRVAALATDDGSMWNPDMLKEGNSIVLLKALNWLVENPERKSMMSLDYDELRLGENSVIVVRSETKPEGNFYAAGKDIYKSNVYPNETGFIDILGVGMGVNYKKEYLNIGMSEDFEKALAITGGQMLPADAAIIEEKIKSASNVETVRQESVSWIFFSMALAVFLIEILLKRIQMIRSSGEY